MHVRGAPRERGWRRWRRRRSGAGPVRGPVAARPALTLGGGGVGGEGDGRGGGAASGAPAQAGAAATARAARLARGEPRYRGEIGER